MNLWRLSDDRDMYAARLVSYSAADVANQAVKRIAIKRIGPDGESVAL